LPSKLLGAKTGVAVGLGEGLGEGEGDGDGDGVTVPEGETDDDGEGEMLVSVVVPPPPPQATERDAHSEQAKISARSRIWRDFMYLLCRTSKSIVSCWGQTFQSNPKIREWLRERLRGKNLAKSAFPRKMRSATMKTAALTILALSLCVAGLIGEEIENFGSELVADGSFLGGDGATPERPAGWTIDDKGGSTTWAEEGHLDKGSAKLVNPDDSSYASMSQTRWISEVENCYLLVFYWKGGGGSLQATIGVTTDAGVPLCQKKLEITPLNYWQEKRFFFEPFPRGTTADIALQFRLDGKGDASLDNISLRRYRGPYTQRIRPYSDNMPVAPADGATITSPALFTWRAVDFAEQYIVQISDGRGFPAGLIATFSTPFCSMYLPVKTGNGNWRVTARSSAVGDVVIVEDRAFSCDKDLKLVLNGGAPAVPPPGTEEDYILWRQTGWWRIIAANTAAQAVPKLTPGAFPQDYWPRLTAKYALSVNWDEAADLLARLSVCATLGDPACLAASGKALDAMAAAIDEALPYLGDGTKARIVLALCSQSVAVPAKRPVCAGLVAKLLKLDALRLANGNLSDYGAFRLVTAAACAASCGLSTTPDLTQSFALFSAGSRFWFIPAGSPLPGALLAADFPLFYFAAAEQHRRLQLPASAEILRRVLVSGSRIYYDFPVLGRSQFGDTVAGASGKALSVLSYLCGYKETAIPAQSPLGPTSACAGYFGLLPLFPSGWGDQREDSFSKELGLAQSCSPVWTQAASLAMRASPHGTVDALGSAQGGFTFLWRGVPWSGCAPASPDGLAMGIGAPLRAPSSGNTYSANLPIPMNTAMADANMVSFEPLAGNAYARAEIEGPLIDSVRSFDRRIALVSPPGSAPLVVVCDEFHPWSGAKVYPLFRLYGKPELNAADQRDIGRGKLGAVEALVSWPPGSRLWQDWGADSVASPITYIDMGHTLAVAPGEAGTGCVVGIRPLLEAQPQLSSLVGDDFRGIAVGKDGFAAFRLKESGIFMVSGVLCDAEFVAWLPMADGRIFIYAVGAKSVERVGVPMLSSSQPISLRAIVTVEKGIARVDSLEAIGPDAKLKLGANRDAEMKGGFFKQGESAVPAPPRLKEKPGPGYMALRTLALAYPGGETRFVYPVILNGFYRLTGKVSGEEGSQGFVRFGSIVQKVTIGKDKRGEFYLEGEFAGPVTICVELDAKCRLTDLGIENSLVVNGGFEAWSAADKASFILEPANLPAALDESVFFTGSRSLCITLEALKGGSITYKTATRSNRVTGSVKVRLEAGKGADISAVLIVTAIDDKGARMTGASVTQELTLKGQWRELKTSLTMPKGATAVAIEVRAKGNGKVWLDEFSAEE